MTHGLETMKRLNDEAVADHFKDTDPFDVPPVQHRLRGSGADHLIIDDAPTPVVSSIPSFDDLPWNKIWKVLLPANKIPLGTQITKPTGQVKYTLTDRVKVYGHPAREIVAEPGTLILVGHGASAAVIEADKLLLAHLHGYQLRLLLDKAES